MSPPEAPQSPQPELQDVALPHGLRLRIQQWGRGARVCLLVHGFGEGAYIWSELIAQLAPLCRIVTVDLRGHGDSDWDPGQDYSARAHALDLEHVVNSLELDELILIGHSLGAELAIHLAHRMPRRVHGLTLIDYAPQSEPLAYQQALRLFQLGLRSYDSEEELVNWLEETRPLSCPQRLRQLARECLRSDGQGSYRLKCDPEMLSSFTRLPPTQAMVCAIRSPVLVVRGRFSALVTQAAAASLANTFADSVLAVIPRSGHAVMTDNPAALQRVLLPFLARVLA